jgi:hypothetical protein
MIPSGTMLTAVFHFPDGAMVAATMIHKLLQKLPEPARSVNIVPSLVGNSLFSTAKMVEAGYTAIYDNKEVNFSDSMTTNKIKMSAAAILKGWGCLQANSGVSPW